MDNKTTRKMLSKYSKQKMGKEITTDKSRKKENERTEGSD
jgi:hypothetical protein